MSGKKYCVLLLWLDKALAYERSTYREYWWHGTLLSDKRDGSGIHYRRNGYYDPSTGRFTQQDPIGLAGGLNLYGFAGGDPVNFSGPFGLSCQPKPQCEIARAYVGREVHAAMNAAVTLFNKARACAVPSAVAVASLASDISGGFALRTVVKAGLKAWGAGQAARTLARNEAVREHAPAAIMESDAALGVALETGTRATLEDIGTSSALNAASAANGSEIGLSDWFPITGTFNAAQTARQNCG